MLTSGLLTKQVVGVTFAGVLVLSSCGGDDGDSEEPEDTEQEAAADECEIPDDRTWVALGLSETVVPEIEVFEEPDGTVSETIPNPWLEPKGAGNSSPPAFEVLTENEDEDPRDAEWLHVDLPTEPTGSEGYIRSENVSVDCIHYRITVDLSDFELTFTHQGEPVQVGGQDAVFPVGLGEDARATQPGSYFITELVIESDDAGNPIPNSVYGDGAYGLDGYSDDPEIIADFADSGGQVGLHGTNEPGVIPGKVSNGCIRLKNEDFNQLKPVVPLGTPVDVVD